MSLVFDQKKILRVQMLRAVAELGAEERKDRSGRLAQRLWLEERFLKSRQVFCYLSMPEEPDTHGIVRRCLAEGKKVAVPRVAAASGSGAGSIEARSVAGWDGAFTPGPFGILEPDPKVSEMLDPSRIDCVILPGLAFDRDGYRLGRGKGYYDRFLAQIGRTAFRIALAFECQRVDRVPRGPHDEPVDLVLYA